MAAAQITPVSWSVFHGVTRALRLNKVTQNDWIFLPDTGTTNPVIQNYAGTVGTFTFGTGVIYNASTAYTATTSSIYVTNLPNGIYNSGVYRTPFYVETTSGEIIQVVKNAADTASSATWTVIRGALGTTASATGLALGNTVYVKNILTLTDAGTGYTYVTYVPLPEDPNVDMFA